MAFPCLRLFIHFPLVSEDSLNSSNLNVDLNGPAYLHTFSCLTPSPHDTFLPCLFTALKLIGASYSPWSISALPQPTTSLSGCSQLCFPKWTCSFPLFMFQLRYYLIREGFFNQHMLFCHRSIYCLYNTYHIYFLLIKLHYYGLF